MTTKTTLRRSHGAFWQLVLGSLALALGAAACVSGSTPPATPQLVATHLIASPTHPATTRTPARTPAAPTRTPSATLPPYESPTPTHTPTPTVMPMVTLVVVAQPVPVGWPIPPEAVTLYAWPEAAAPHAAITRLEDAINQVALVALDCGQPVLSNMLAHRTVGNDYFPLPERCPPLRPLTPPVTLVDVAFAIEFIPAGAVIAPYAVVMRPWPEAALPHDAITTFAGVVGKTAQTDIFAEQLFRQPAVQPPES